MIPVPPQDSKGEFEPVGCGCAFGIIEVVQLLLIIGMITYAWNHP